MERRALSSSSLSIAQFMDVAELLKFLICSANSINFASTSLKMMLACALVWDAVVLTEPAALAASEGPPDTSGTFVMAGSLLAVLRWGSLADTMKSAYFELGLIFLLSLRRGLTLLGVVRFPGASWFEFPVPPPLLLVPLQHPWMPPSSR